MLKSIYLWFLICLVPFVLAQEDVTYTEGEWTFQCEIERNIVYPFNDIKTLTGKSLAQCCEACWDDALCVLWAWVNTTCTLKDNQEGEPVSHEGAVSGWVGSVWETKTPPPGPSAIEEATPVTIDTLANTEIEIYLWGSDIHKQLPGMFKDKVVSTSSSITSIPALGELYQNDIGRTRIIFPNTEIDDKLHRVVFRSPRVLPGDKESASTSFTTVSTIYFEKDQPRRFSLKVNVNIRVGQITQKYSLCEVVTTISCEGDEPVVLGEVGSISITDQPVEVHLKNKYKNPVVIAQPLSFSGPDAAITRVTNVVSDAFIISIHEPTYLNGAHKAEKVSYLVLEAGSWVLENGYRLEVGKSVSSSTVGGGIAASWTTVTFPATGIFNTPPVVLSQTQSYNDVHWVATRQREVTEVGFKVALEEEEDNEETHGGEIIGWVALDKASSQFSDSINYEVNTAYPVTNDWTTVNFAQSHTGEKNLLAVMQTTMGTDSAHLRYKDLVNNSVKLKVEEEESKDKETIHVGEVVGYVVFEGVGTLKATPGDCSATPIAENKDERAVIGEVAKFQLLKKDEYGSVSVEIRTLPLKGLLFQYESDYEEAEDVLSKFEPISKPSALTDLKGRVLYIPFPGAGGESDYPAGDSFSYVLIRNSAQSNVATVAIEITKDGPPKPPSTTGGKPPLPPPVMFKGGYGKPLVVVLGLSILLIGLIVILTFFLYKKQYGARDMIGFFKSKAESDGRITYFPSGDEDSLTSPAETHFAEHSDDLTDTTDSAYPLA